MDHAAFLRSLCEQAKGTVYTKNSVLGSPLREVGEDFGVGDLSKPRDWGIGLGRGNLGQDVRHERGQAIDPQAQRRTNLITKGNQRYAGQAASQRPWPPVQQSANTTPQKLAARAAGGQAVAAASAAPPTQLTGNEGLEFLLDDPAFGRKASELFTVLRNNGKPDDEARRMKNGMVDNLMRMVVAKQMDVGQAAEKLDQIIDTIWKQRQ